MFQLLPQRRGPSPHELLRPCCNACRMARASGSVAALMVLGMRQHARPESISKRARSATQSPTRVKNGYENRCRGTAGPTCGQSTSVVCEALTNSLGKDVSEPDVEPPP